MSNKFGRKAKAFPGTYEQLIDMVFYDANTGAMETMGAYKSTGTQMKDGYLHMPLPRPDTYEDRERGHRKTTYYRADHIAWMLATGTWPDGWMEHINGMRMDNALDNLVHVNADGERWWYGIQSPGEGRQLVMVEDVTFRVIAGDGNTLLKPVVVEAHRTARMRPVDTNDPHDEDYEYPKGEFGVDWT